MGMKTLVVTVVWVVGIENWFGELVVVYVQTAEKTMMFAEQIFISGFIIHENTREFTKRQRRVRSGGRLGDPHRKVVSHCKGAMVEYTHAPLDISPLSAFGLADQSPPGY